MSYDIERILFKPSYGIVSEYRYKITGEGLDLTVDSSTLIVQYCDVESIFEQLHVDKHHCSSKAKAISALKGMANQSINIALLINRNGNLIDLNDEI